MKPRGTGSLLIPVPQTATELGNELRLQWAKQGEEWPKLRIFNDQIEPVFNGYAQIYNAITALLLLLFLINTKKAAS